VFSCKLVSHLWKLVFKIKKRWEYNNEKLDGLCIGTVGFWAIGYTIMYGDSLIFYRKSKLVFDSVADMHSLFFCICSHCRNNCIRGNRRKNKILNIPYLFFDDDRFYIPNFWALGLARRRLVN
jgi:hypothetical protein